MHETGTSTRKVQRIAERMGTGRLSKDQASSMARSLDADVEELLARPLGDLAMPYLWLDATYVKRRRDGHVSSTAIVTAIGCDADGWMWTVRCSTGGAVRTLSRSTVTTFS